jgi:Flp pilus assembly protein TadB
MSAPRRLRWSAPEGSSTRHPYRDTVIVYACLALIVVLVALATGGGIVRALVVAAVFFAVASGWAFYRLRRRARAARRGLEQA